MLIRTIATLLILLVVGTSGGVAAELRSGREVRAFIVGQSFLHASVRAGVGELRSTFLANGIWQQKELKSGITRRFKYEVGPKGVLCLRPSNRCFLLDVQGRNFKFVNFKGQSDGVLFRRV